MTKLALVSLLLFTTACDARDKKPAAAPTTSVTLPGANSTPAAAAEPQAGLAKAGAGKAELGKAAPTFELSDLEGSVVNLAELRGKTVVVEWFNPECPFVKLSHSKGSLKGFASQVASDSVVWLAINSGGPGRQGYGIEKNKQATQNFGLSHRVLLDPDGSVGKSYGATNTPHLFIIDAQGSLVYRGAIDNSPDGEGQTPSGGKLINYVAQALGELSAGKPVSIPETKAYGCSVKYADPS